MVRECKGWMEKEREREQDGECWDYFLPPLFPRLKDKRDRESEGRMKRER